MISFGIYIEILSQITKSKERRPCTFASSFARHEKNFL
nr:MAG TPA: hypothetical protein [Caudoviricetes sp.]